ncbi:MAG: sialate O-acetylesterase, partial [Phycisphaerae bacterium]|nr:sialate O-acetylesterase [Phycisphaerae bacterium]
AKWRKDLGLPELRFYIGELSTKTVWGMDNRSNMYAISLAQKKVCREDDLVEYIPTNHVGLRTKSNNGLHYHYGTLGNLEHGHNYATAYLRNIGKLETVERTLNKWPYEKGSTVKLFVLAGHRNMEGEVSFVENLKKLNDHKELAKDNIKVPYSYSLGGGYKVSKGFEPLGPAGMYDTFGPELSFGSNLQNKVNGNIAIAKFTHSGSQIIDWTPEGSEARSRNLYPAFIAYIQSQVKALEDKGHKVKIEGIFYHVGENDMCFPSYKTNAAKWVKLFVEQSRKDMKQKDLKWFISQQRPPIFEGANKTDVMAQLEEFASTDNNTFHVKAPGLVKEDEHILMDTEAVIELGQLLSNTYLEQVK